MAQFDSLIIFPVLFSLLLMLFLHYYLSIKLIIPSFFEVKKFREKKQKIVVFYKSFNDNDYINLTNSYKPIF